MANHRNQQRGGPQHYQDRNFQGTHNQMGGAGQGSYRSNQQSAYQGNHGQYSGNYGPDTNYTGGQAYGGYETQGDFRGYADNSNTRFGSDSHSGAPNDSYGNYGLSRDAGYNPRETNANEAWEPENSRGPRGYGHSQSYGGALGYPDESLRSPQSGHYHDPDYHQWRTEQIRALDNDYQAWRAERYSNFSNEFGEWRKGRKDKPSGSGTDATSGNAGTASKSK